MKQSLSSDLSIKIDYLKDRENPVQVFEAMASYIGAYENFGQLVFDSLGIEEDFKFELNGIHVSSIESKLSALSALKEKVLESVVQTVFKSAHETFRRLDGRNSEINDEEQVDEIVAVRKLHKFWFSGQRWSMADLS